MPEGDTIHKIAANLAPRLVGTSLERVTTQGLARAVAGATVTAVAAHGKHLVIDLDTGAQLRVHLGMNGRQRSYARAEGDQVIARTSPGRASLVLVTADGVHLWRDARTVEISDRRSPLRGHAIAALGADLLAPDFDARAVATRAAGQGARPIGDVLLDQRIAAGIGNVYKSEALYVRGVDPRTPTSALALEQLVAIYETARAQMRANLGSGPRTTRTDLAGTPPDTDRFFVYSRTSKPCRRCGRAIESYRLGDPPRWTWSCPGCQAPPGTGTGDSR